MRSVLRFKSQTVKVHDSWQNYAMKCQTPHRIPLSLYIHIPWCERKCPYCDFNSHDNQKHFDEKRYVQALLDDLDQDIDDIRDRRINSIFIGGGTPSLFSGEAYSALLTEISSRLDIVDAEITLEANPSSSERDKFAAYREAGINRLSIGIQSFDAELLKKIGRVHNGNDALNAASAARAAGFDNFNLDIMFALPQQNVEQSLHDVECAIAQKPTHLSCYQLTLEPNTLFYKSPPKLPNSDTAWEMQSALQAELAKANYQQYEVSAYAQPDRECQHNRNYWEFGDYLGIGAGAHGKVTLQDNRIKRYWKQKQPKRYLESAASHERLGVVSFIDANALPFEFMLNTLRLKSGFQKALFEQRTLLDFSVISQTVNEQIHNGLLVETQQHIKPTEKGYRFIDSMLNDYL